MKKFIATCTLTLWVAACVFAQSADSALWLSEVLIEGVSDQKDQIGYQVRTINAQELENLEGLSFTDLLSRKVPGGLRPYGISGVATANLRGTGSSHTAVLWNGVSLESPSNGLFDLSQVTTGLLSNISIQFGGSSGAFGSGAIGGAIHLNNDLPVTPGTYLSTSHLLGSFGRFYQRYKIEHSKKKHRFGLSWFKERADNDFKFNNVARRDAPVERWQHAAVMRDGLLVTYQYDLSEKDQLKVIWWHQNNQLEIPNPFTVSVIGEATQDDLFDRFLITFDQKRTNHSWQFASAALTHQIDYADPRNSIASKTDFLNWHNQIQLTGDYSFGNIKAEVSHRWENVTSTGYATENTVDRQRASARIGLKRNLPGWASIILNLRQEWIEGTAAPTIPSLVITRSAGPTMVFHGSISRIYRVPTFNDLHWLAPGAEGNPNLKSEQGWTWEVGVDWKLKPQTDLFNLSASLFSNHIQDWILWSVNASQRWSPDNIKRVWSRGVQIESSSTFLEQSNLRLRGFGNYQLTHSTNQKISNLGNPAELGQQLIYTPIHQASAGLEVQWPFWEFRSLFNFVGEQFTTGENNPLLALEAFWMTNIIIQHQARWNKLQGTLRLELNNLFDKAFQVRAGYPMPGFHVNVGLNLKLSYPMSLT